MTVPPSTPTATSRREQILEDRVPGTETIYETDFLQSTVGPHCVHAGTDKEHNYEHYSIDSDNGREGMFDESAVYAVLEPADIEAMIKQLRGEDPEPQVLKL